MSSDEQVTLFRQQIPRWIVNSTMQMLKTVTARYNTGKIVLLLESDVTDDARRKNSELIIVHFDGPNRVIRTKITVRYTTDLTLIVTTHNKQQDMYAHERTLGVAIECFPACIPVYRYGDGPLDNGNQMGVLQQITDPNTFGHGSPGTDVPVYQSSISARYRMDFNEDSST